MESKRGPVTSNEKQEHPSAQLFVSDRIQLNRHRTWQVIQINRDHCKMCPISSLPPNAQQKGALEGHLKGDAWYHRRWSQDEGHQLATGTKRSHPCDPTNAAGTPRHVVQLNRNPLFLCTHFLNALVRLVSPRPIVVHFLSLNWQSKCDKPAVHGGLALSGPFPKGQQRETSFDEGNRSMYDGHLTGADDKTDKTTTTTTTRTTTTNNQPATSNQERP